MLTIHHYTGTCPSSLSPTKRVCPACSQIIGRESCVFAKDRNTYHERCFVCCVCHCRLKDESYGIDLNGKLYCKHHWNSSRPSDNDYRTLASGWLFKQGAVVKKWRRRYFVLPVDSCVLRYYKTKLTTQQPEKGSIDLSAISAIQPAYLFVPPDKNHPELPSGSLPALQLVTHCRIWNLACETDSVREYWMEAIRTAQVTCGYASPAASCGVGRGHRGRCCCCSPGFAPSPSPPPFPGSAGSSPPGDLLGHSEFVAPHNIVKTSVPVPAALLSPSSAFSQGDDDAETSSPEDDCSIPQESRPRTGSGLGRGDGSAAASQYLASTTISNVEISGMRRVIHVTPIVVPTQSMPSSGSGTPTVGGVTNVVFPDSPSRPPAHPWQPSTPSTPRGSNDSLNNASWDSSSTSSSASRESETEMRCRAVSAGASFQLQMKQRVIKIGVKPVVPQQQQTRSPKVKDALLCSPRNISIVSTDIKVITSPPTCEDQLPSLAFFTTAN